MGMGANGRQGTGSSGSLGMTSYEVFIGVMTVMSLLVAGYLLLDWIDPIIEADTPTQIVYILLVMDLMFCAVFFVDFVRSLLVAEGKVAYLFGERPGRSWPYGSLELVGAIPILFPLRFFRVFRLMRAGWTMSDLGPKALARAAMASRAGSAVYITVIVTFLVLLFGSITVLWFELPDPDANITTSSDALWWTFVTITTVGYGDQFPVSEAGRVIAVITMIVGIGIFGVIAGSLASLLSAPQQNGVNGDDAGDGGGVEMMGTVTTELAALRAEVAELRRSIDAARDDRPEAPSTD
jgi:voltage-gated potassium channel Kch